MDQADLNALPFLAENFDILLVSSKLSAIELYPLFPIFCNRNMRIVYCPHGNSDKGHTATKELSAPRTSLVYGNHMLDLLRDTGMLDSINHTIATGNYRYSFFRQHQDWYQKLARDAVFSKLDETKKTIFYAPTWQGTENPSSFYTDCAALIEQVTPPFNLLIKLHPYLYERDPVKTTLIIEQYKDHPQVLFLEEFPPIYPLLALSDAYLGDFSSIGYDFLAFDQPMYFFNPGKSDLYKDKRAISHRCGMEISTGEHPGAAHVHLKLELQAIPGQQLQTLDARPRRNGDLRGGVSRIDQQRRRAARAVAGDLAAAAVGVPQFDGGVGVRRPRARSSRPRPLRCGGRRWPRPRQSPLDRPDLRRQLRAPGQQKVVACAVRFDEWNGDHWGVRRT